MSLTTSVKYVRLVLSPSRYAIIADNVIVFVVMMGVLVSSLPLAASLVLLALCFAQLRSSEILVTPLYGDVIFSSEQELQTKDRKHKVKRIFFSVCGVGLVIVCDGYRLILWRDSATERDYRRLLFFLRGSYD